MRRPGASYLPGSSFFSSLFTEFFTLSLIFDSFTNPVNRFKAQ